MQRWLIPVTLLGAFQVVPRVARACSLPTNYRFERDPAHNGDTTPPSAIAVGDVDVGREPAHSTCQARGWFAFAVSATDDATPADQLGYQVRVVSGELPAGLGRLGDAIGGNPIRANVDGGLHFYFAYDAPSFAVDLELRAVDLNGNLGPPVVVSIASDAPDDGGCNAGGGGSLLAGGSVALLAVLARRRRGRDTDVVISGAARIRRRANR